MNPFQKHEIKHLSASSLNLWRGSPGVWALKYLAKIREDENAAMNRGKAVEAGMHHFLGGQKNCEDAALVNFDLNMAGLITDDLETERELIPPMVRQCQKWMPPGELIATQLRVEHWFDGIPAPIIGYLDFVFDNGLIVDLKTTKACPSTPRADHVRQISVYMAAREATGGLLYVTDKRHAFYLIDQEARDKALSDLEVTARSLMHFLDRCDSTKDALRSLPMDTDHYAFPKMKVPLAKILLAG